MNNTSDNQEKKKSGGKAPKPSRGKVEETTEKPERIAKRMARAGLCSRREAEAWIAQGRVRVNGNPLSTPAFTVTTGDRIEVDGTLLGQRERTRLWLFHKPTGTVTTNRDPEGRKTIFEALPDGLPRLMTVGRLDINTEGLLLMTNDGGLARALELPSTGWLRRYRVRVHGQVKEADLAELEKGIAVDGVLYGSILAELEQTKGTNSWLVVSLREGKNREIKNVMSAIGLEVTRLIRVSYGPFQLGDLPAGVIREVRSRTLREQLGEKLIGESGADFDAPIINLSPTVPRSAGKAAQLSKSKTKKNPDRRKPGTARQEVLDRLTTSTKKPASRPASRRPGSKGKKPR